MGDNRISMDGRISRRDVGQHRDASTYSGYTAKDWALLYIEHYGGIDGDHHKAWVLDQVVRILHGTPVVLSVARWQNGYEELRFRLAEPTPDYHCWVNMMRGELSDDGEREYDYDIGIAP